MSFTVTVTDVQETATVTVGGLSNATVQENRAWTSPKPSVSGAIGEVVWSHEGTDAEDFTIDSSTGVVSMAARDYESPADANANNDYEVTVRATDADDNTATRSITVTVRDVRESTTLTVTGLGNADVAENTAFTSSRPELTGTPIGIVEWTLEGTDAADFTIDASTGVVSMVARDFESPEDSNGNNVYGLTVKVTDSDQNTASVPFTVTVTNVRETVSLVIAGHENAEVAENRSWRSARPSVSGSPNGDVAWVVEGADAEDFSIDASTGVVSMARRNFEMPADDDADNVYELTVRVTDDDDNTATVSITVTVTDVRELASLGITGLSDRSVAENTAFTSERPALTGTPIGAVAWTLEGDDAEDFTIDASTGAVSMVAQDYESPVDANADSVYQVTVKALDEDGNSATASFALTVTDIKEATSLSIGGLSDGSVPENVSFTSARPTLIGSPIADVVWTLEGVDAGDLAVDASTGVVSMVARDYENPRDEDTDNGYTVTVRVTDSDENTAAVSITVTVTDVRESVSLGITGLSDRTAAENARFRSATPVLTGTPIGEVAWTAEGVDAGAFTIDGNSGVLSMVARDYESPVDAGGNNVYVVTVRVTDDDQNTAAVSITVTVTDVRESVSLGITGLSDRNIAENARFTSARPALTGTPIGAVDWVLEGVDAGAFTIDAATGVLSMVARDYETPEDTGGNNVYMVTVRVTDADQNTAVVSIRATVTDVRETVSLAITGLSNGSVAENLKFTSATPALTGPPIGDVAWTLEGTDAGDFTIDGATGVVSMVARDHESPVDANTDNAYEVTVRATDADENTATRAIAVTVTDALETATLGVTGLSSRNVAENAEFTSARPTLTGTPIGTVTWTIEGADAGDFTVDTSAGVVTMAQRDFESPSDDDTDNRYEVTVKASDTDSNTASVSFTVTVTDVVETVALSIAGLSDGSVLENAGVCLGNADGDRAADRGCDLDGRRGGRCRRRDRRRQRRCDDGRARLRASRGRQLGQHLQRDGQGHR